MPRLIKYDFNVPGGYTYVQDMGNGSTMTFDGNTAWKAQVGKILKVRMANQLPRATRDEVWADLEAYTCKRMPSRCTGGTTADVLPILAARRAKGCGSCGGRKA